MNNLIQALNYNDPVFPYGEPLVTFGLENRGVVNGLGLVTRGFLWQEFDLWLDTDYYRNLVTSWSIASGSSITTSWSVAAGSSITTSWVSPQFGMYGDYPTA